MLSLPEGRRALALKGLARRAVGGAAARREVGARRRREGIVLCCRGLRVGAWVLFVEEVGVRKCWLEWKSTVVVL